MSRSRVLLVALLCIGLMPTIHAEDAPLPFGMRAPHLNIVLSVDDAEKVHEFYGTVVGLKRIPDLNFPGETYMIRYMGGDTEVKFIVTGEDLPSHEGGTRTARGIRLMAFFLPESERVGVDARLAEHGYPAATYTEGDGYRWGLTRDAEDNVVEFVFFDEGTPEEKFKEFQIGMTVTDTNEMTEFLDRILGLEEAGSLDMGEGRMQYRFKVGHTTLKYWNGAEGLPAHVGGPFDVQGMCLVQFLVPDVDAVRAQVLERGGVIHTEPFALGTMATIMFVDGPDGILFEFAGPLLPRLRKQADSD